MALTALPAETELYSSRTCERFMLTKVCEMLFFTVSFVMVGHTGKRCPFTIHPAWWSVTICTDLKQHQKGCCLLTKLHQFTKAL